MGKGKRVVASDAEEEISPQDMIAFVSGVATTKTVQRIWARSVSDEKTRYQVAWCLPPEDEEEQIQDAITDAEDSVQERLHNRARTLTDRFVAPQPLRILERVLSVIGTVLNLPCFAPALAASDMILSPKIFTQTIATAEGVQVEFQQLPSVLPTADSGPILRVIVDASSALNDGIYAFAIVTVVDDYESLTSFSVPLSAQGRGLLDVRNLPPARSASRLIGVRLSTS